MNVDKDGRNEMFTGWLGRYVHRLVGEALRYEWFKAGTARHSKRHVTPWNAAATWEGRQTDGCYSTMKAKDAARV